MTRHLKACGAAVARSSGALPSSRSFHLFVEARYNKQYWLHLAVPAQAPLSRLDAFLRDIWLECCGHLSAFTIAGERYDSGEMGGVRDGGMQVRLDRLLSPGMSFTYEYDFGSTTELNLKTVGGWYPTQKRGAVELLARNEAPEVLCQSCGSRPASQICSECVWQDTGWLCGPCAEAHECGTEMCLPVVNSPRAGVCGYAG